MCVEKGAQQIPVTRMVDAPNGCVKNGDPENCGFPVGFPLAGVPVLINVDRRDF